MSSAQLLSLDYELSLLPHGFLYLFTAEAYYHNIPLGTGTLGSIQYMLQHWLACGLVENLRQLGLHTGTLACCQNNGN